MKHVAILYALNLRDLLMGSAFLKSHSPDKLPLVETVHDSHRVVFEFDETQDTSDRHCCDQAFERFNHPDWNPLGTEKGQATLKERGLSHTSMSIGDIVAVQDKEDGVRFYLCDGMGSGESWTRIPLRTDGWTE